MLLAAGLPRPPFDVRVAVLEDGGWRAPELRARGIAVDELGWKRFFDLGVFRRVRQLFAEFRPEVVHAWSQVSLRMLAAAGALGRCRLVVSAATLPPRLGFRWCGVDGLLLRCADLIVAAGPAEAEQYRQQTLGADKVVEIRPGVSLPIVAGTRHDLCRSLGIQQDARLIVCSGPLVPENGIRDAVWTLEILKYLFSDLHLLLIGEGPDRAPLERFIRCVGAQGHVHFLGSRPDGSALLTHAEVVWIPDRDHGESNVALEAMAAGRPVVASRMPALAEIVKDGETGFLVNPGDKVTLARRTRWLLENRNRCRQMGEAGNLRSQLDFSVSQLVNRFACLYERVLSAECVPSTRYSAEALA
jgi:glycosyltransferase involved in cell wall biosynthesis